MAIKKKNKKTQKGKGFFDSMANAVSVSYTHLTLPTIYSV